LATDTKMYLLHTVGCIGKINSKNQVTSAFIKKRGQSEGK